MEAVQAEKEDLQRRLAECNEKLRTKGAGGDEVIQEKRTEDALKQANDELEHRVEERTAELVKTNRKLSEKLEVHKRVEQELKLSAEIMENMAEGICLLSASCQFVFTNPRFDEIFGYETGELIGRHTAILNAPGDPPRKRQQPKFCRNWRNLESGRARSTTSARTRRRSGLIPIVRFSSIRSTGP